MLCFPCLSAITLFSSIILSQSNLSASPFSKSRI
uniref:Gsh1 n=1 Tax=Arundo donax TaxID=35708 RepID=A0A0A9DUN8_ARUDO